MDSIDYGARFLGNLALIFITLKLTGLIDWSWWWVTVPLWGAFALTIVVLIVLLLVWGVLLGLNHFLSKRKARS